MIEGKNIIGYRQSAEGSNILKAVDPVSGEQLEGSFVAANEKETDEAVKIAVKAFQDYSRKSGTERAGFLEEIAVELEALDQELVRRASAETGLPEARIKGERGRTINQLLMFAKLLKDGSWVEASIDQGQPDRTPLPKPDIRKMLRPVGPVVVFTASNFPLAFSTAGGDTASALAAGNPVIVKAHESHLGTNELVSGAIRRAAEKCGMPEGVFSSLNGDGYKTGKLLVQHPKVKSVAFTGSLQGGKALYDLAQEREEPIPVFSEMGSINPVVLLPGKLRDESKKIAAMYAGSITMGGGQFCTKPGLLIGIKGEELEKFKKSLTEELNETEGAEMLNEKISSSFHSKRKKLTGEGSIETLLDNNEGATNRSSAVIAAVNSKTFIANPALHEEVFGPYSLIVECGDKEDLREVLKLLKGQLTCTAMCNDEDFEVYGEVLEQLASVAGRVIFNGVPTGVEVGYAMHHGGPFPATTDSRFTSVGTDAIKRFARPVCYQDAPQAFLPGELRDGNPLKIWRKIDGELTK